MKMEYRKPTGWYQVEHAKLHNLKDLSVKLPLGVMTVIAGVAGSGKSSLMEYFTSQYPGEVISIRQKDIGINLRSTPATYRGYRGCDPGALRKRTMSHRHISVSIQRAPARRVRVKV